MGKYYGYDIIDALIARLEDKTYGINAYIKIISATRGEVCQPVKDILTGGGNKQFPECYIKLEDSIFIEKELSNNIELETEIYPARVTTMIKSNDPKLDKWSEIHIEALQKSLHGYSTANITMILCTGSIRMPMYDQQNNTANESGVTISIRIN